jgi:hypothetical protein
MVEGLRGRGDRFGLSGGRGCFWVGGSVARSLVGQNLGGKEEGKGGRDLFGKVVVHCRVVVFLK